MADLTAASMLDWDCMEQLASTLGVWITRVDSRVFSRCPYTCEAVAAASAISENAVAGSRARSRTLPAHVRSEHCPWYEHKHVHVNAYRV